MIFDEDTVGVWFIAIPGGDWLASLRREAGGFKMEFRFRYHKDDKAFDSADEKKWYAATFTGTEAEAISHFDTLLAVQHDMGGIGPYRLLRGDKPFEAFMQEFLQAPFVTAQPVH